MGSPVRFAADPESYFAGYLPPLPVARHARTKQGWLTRLKAWVREGMR